MPRLSSRRTPTRYLMRFALGAVLCAATALRSSAQGLPERISDSTFWRMITAFSEEGGYFRSDNFVSNEAAFQYVIPGLQAALKSGGVYVGVGPDQNFTYVVALAPKIAFIVDIRRQNMLQHLMYKALIEMSGDRVEFLTRLFSRARPPGVDTTSSAPALFAALSTVAPDTSMYRVNREAIKGRLLKTHGFTLSQEDMTAIDYVFGSFFIAGPDITYSVGQGGGGRSFGGYGMPSYWMLMVETDGQGQHRSYVASEANFRVLKDLQTRNLLVPLVGDFAGDKALRAVGTYLRERGATVSAFYTSNVEQYLFQESDKWSRFYTNVSALPIDSASTFIRSVSSRGWVTPQNPNSRSAQLVSSIAELLKAFREGRILSYQHVVEMSRY